MVTTQLLLVDTAAGDTVVTAVQRVGGGTRFAGVLGDEALATATLDRCRRPCAS